MPYHISGGRIDPRVPIDHNEIFVCLDGDPKKLTLQDESPDGRFSVKFKLGNSGRPVDPTHMPTRCRRKGNKGFPIYDVDGMWGGGLLVTDKFKEIVEAFEPDVHQFFPLRIEQGGKLVAERFIFYICNRLDTLAKDRCQPAVAAGERYMPAYDGNDKRVYDSSKIGAHHAWRDRFSGGTMVSNELLAALAEQNFTGFAFQEFEQI